MSVSQEMKTSTGWLRQAGPGLAVIWKVALVCAGLLPWIFYASTIQVGLESLIDEGQMLLLPNRPKPLGHLGSQSGVLIGFFTDRFEYKASVLLWTRYIMQCVSVGALLISSLAFLKTRVNGQMDTLRYTGLFLLVSSICLYLFTKTVSYNHVQQAAVLLSVSCYLLYHTYPAHRALRSGCLLGMGFFSLIGILNIAPSGLAFSAFLVFILVAEVNFSKEALYPVLVYYLLGVLGGIAAFHVFVKDLGELIRELQAMYSMVGKLNRSYDVFSILYYFLRSLLSLFLVCILSVGVWAVYELIRKKTRSAVYAATFASLALVSLITYSLTFTKTGAIYEWVVSPLVIVLFVAYSRGFDKQVIRYRWTILLLAGIPVIAPLGTNLPLTLKYGYFLTTWLIAAILVANRLEPDHKKIITVLFLGVALTWNVQSLADRIEKAGGYTAQSALSPLAGIYISPKQKDYFEGVYRQLKSHQFSRGDTIIAFQPDLMTVFAVGGTAGHRVYFVPEDFLNEDLSLVGRPRFLILNDYSYQQISPAIKEQWGFPEAYEKIMVGSPETVDYFSAHKPRMLFCLKPGSN